VRVLRLRTKAAMAICRGASSKEVEAHVERVARRVLAVASAGDTAAFAANEAVPWCSHEVLRACFEDLATPLIVAAAAIPAAPAAPAVAGASTEAAAVVAPSTPIAAAAGAEVAFGPPGRARKHDTSRGVERYISANRSCKYMALEYDRPDSVGRPYPSAILLHTGPRCESLRTLCGPIGDTARGVWRPSSNIKAGSSGVASRSTSSGTLSSRRGRAVQARGSVPLQAPLQQHRLRQMRSTPCPWSR